MTQGRYWAFISYSHADEAVATWLHKALETYRLPRKLVGTVQGGVEIPARLFPVFRDRDELASSDSLGAKINDALARAEALIVIASKKSATSHWVNEEIRAFKALGKGRRVFCVIADGEPFASDKGAPDEECFAPALRRHVDADGQLTEARAEPIAADIRPGKDGKHDALLKLVAGILDIGLDALKQRDLQRRQRRLTLIASAAIAASVFTTGLSVFAIQARNEAQAQRQLAEARQTQAEGLIQFMLGDLRKKLEPIGKLDVLDAVGEQAMAYFGQVPPESLSDTELAARAQALRQIGDVRVQQGKLAEASPAFREALKLDEEIVRRHPEDQQAIFNKAQSEYYVGARYFYGSEWDKALPWFDRYERSARALVKLDSDKLAWQQEVSYALQNQLTMAYRSKRFERCVDYGQQAEQQNQRMWAHGPASVELQLSRSESLNAYSACLVVLGRAAEAVAAADRHLEIRRSMAEQSPDNRRTTLLFAVALDATAVRHAYAGQFADAVKMAAEAAPVFSRLLKADPANVEWRSFAATAQVNRAAFLALDDQLPAAYAQARDALVHLRELQATDYSPGVTRLLTTAARNIEIALQLAGVNGGDLPASLELLERSLSLELPDIEKAGKLEPALAVACALMVEAGKGSRQSGTVCSRLNEIPIDDAQPDAALVAQALRENALGIAPEQRTAARELRGLSVFPTHWVLLQNRLASRSRPLPTGE